MDCLLWTSQPNQTKPKPKSIDVLLGMILDFMSLLLVWPMVHLSVHFVGFFFFMCVRSVVRSSLSPCFILWVPHYPFNKTVISLIKIIEDSCKIDGNIVFDVVQMKSHKNPSTFNLSHRQLCAEYWFFFFLSSTVFPCRVTNELQKCC